MNSRLTLGPIIAPKMEASLEFKNFPYTEFKKFLSINHFSIKNPSSPDCEVMAVYEHKGTTYKLFVKFFWEGESKWYKIFLKVYRRDNKFAPKYDPAQHLNEILKQFYNWDKMANPVKFPIKTDKPEETPNSPPTDVSQNETLGNPEE